MSRIVTNAFFLYVRMLVVMVISIFTTRIILQTLGAEDFGLFYTVAGVVSLLSFVTSSMSSATSRFIAYEIGKREEGNVQEVFTSAWTIHALLALLFALWVETVGVWFLNHYLKIPAGREWVANVLLQLSVAMSVLSVLQVPFTASVMAHEKMNVFAAIEVGVVVLKLLILYLVPYIDYDHVIVYGALLLFISLLSFLFYMIYCNRALGNCDMRYSLKSGYVKKMFHFSGWDLFGNLSVAARSQGVIVVLECFFGTVMVTAASIAMRVQISVMSFASNVMAAFRPQIVKSYATGDYTMVDRLVRNAGVYTSLLLYLVTVPVILDMDFIFTKWLGKFPAYTTEFCRLTLIFNIFANFSSVVISAIHANGNIKRPSFINGSLYLSVIPISVLMFKMDLSPVYVYFYNIAAVSLGMLSNVWTLHLLMPAFHMGKFLFHVLFKSLLVGASAFFLAYIVSTYFEPSWYRTLLICLVSTLSIIVLALTILLDKEEVKAVKNKLTAYVR